MEANYFTLSYKQLYVNLDQLFRVIGYSGPLQNYLGGGLAPLILRLQSLFPPKDCVACGHNIVYDMTLSTK